MHPIEMPAEELQQKIVSENILQPGKRAKIVTSDGQVQKIKVSRVDTENGVIETNEDPIQIADIVAVETRDFSMGKTALLTAGSYTILVLVAAAVAPVLIL
jgi:hypothetical protein